MIKALLFDWGNTLMVDFNLPGPMYEWEKVAWVPGAEASLKKLSKTYPCYVATNAGQSNAEAVIRGLNRVGADRYFSGVFASSDLGYEKPDPLFFRTIVDALNLSEGELVMIGDHYLKDIVGAGNSGIRTVFLTSDQHLEKYPMANIIIHSMEELPAAIEKL